VGRGRGKGEDREGGTAEEWAGGGVAVVRANPDNGERKLQGEGGNEKEVGGRRKRGGEMVGRGREAGTKKGGGRGRERQDGRDEDKEGGGEGEMKEKDGKETGG